MPSGRAEELLAAFTLTEPADRRVRTYPGGMRRRLDIAAGLIITPDLLFLDEPTTGLDPRSRNDVWTMIRGIVTEGTTVLLTTQYFFPDLHPISEADEQAAINAGGIRATGIHYVATKPAIDMTRSAQSAMGARTRRIPIAGATWKAPSWSSHASATH